MLSLADFRSRFWAATAEADRIAQKKIQPIRQQIDAKRAEIGRLQVEVKALGKQLQEAQKPLVLLENEKAACARACKGKVGERP